jgi:hypothetical protein
MLKLLTIGTLGAALVCAMAATASAQTIPPPIPPNIRYIVPARRTATLPIASAKAALRESHAPSKDMFQVRAYSTAGRSPYTAQLVTEFIDILLPVQPELPPRSPPPSVDRPIPR